MYTPHPFDTKQIILSEDLTGLTEQLAGNVHEVWALGRMKEGWIYGEKEDPAARISPLLVPYADLPESEKDYDRNTAMETLKFIVGHGYTIEKGNFTSDTSAPADAPRGKFQALRAAMGGRQNFLMRSRTCCGCSKLRLNDSYRRVIQSFRPPERRKCLRRHNSRKDRHSQEHEDHGNRNNHQKNGSRAG